MSPVDLPTSGLSEEMNAIERVLQGDREAYALLVERYGGALFRYLLRLVGRPDEADDLVQESFLRAYLSLASYDAQYRFSTWLFRIAHHRAVDWLRAQRPAPQTAEEWLPAEDCPQEEAFAALAAEQVRAALARLAPAQRAVLELTFYEGLSCREVAQVLGCPVGTVKSRLSHARRALRGALERLEVTGGAP